MKRRALTQAERRMVYAKTVGHCAYCGTEIPYKAMQADHVNPISGPESSNDLENFLPACRSCNHYKSTLSLDSFRASVEAWPDVLNRDSVTYKNAVRFGMVTPTPKPVVFYFEKLGIVVPERKIDRVLREIRSRSQMAIEKQEKGAE